MFMRLHRTLTPMLLALASSPVVSEEIPSPSASSPVVITAATDSQTVQNRQGTSDRAVSSGDSANCWEQAAARYSLDAWLLYAIANQESSLNPRALNKNRDGSYDVGLMQINSTHFPRLASMGITPEMLWEPCMNIHVGAWVLAETIRIFGPTWNAVGGYNAGTRKNAETDAKRARYARRIERLYYRLQHNAIAGK